MDFAANCLPPCQTIIGGQWHNLPAFWVTKKNAGRLRALVSWPLLHPTVAEWLEEVADIFEAIAESRS